MGTQTRNALSGVSLSLRSAQERLSDPLGQRIELESPLINFLLKARIAGLPQIRSLFVLNDEGLLANSSLWTWTAGSRLRIEVIFAFLPTG